MSDDKLEILLAAKDASEKTFRDLQARFDGLQKKMTETANAGASFDKMKTQVVGALAAVYTVVKTTEKVIESAKTGSLLKKQEEAFSNLSDAAGTSSRRMLESLKATSKGVVDESALMTSSGKALLMSIPADKITELMKIAAATSRMTGQTITEAFGDITMGVARQSKMILDNLGIIVNVDKANEDYARTLHKTADALTDAEKRQAFMNAVLKSGNDMIARLGASHGSLDGVNKLVAAQTDLWNEVNKTVATFLDKELSQYATMLNWFETKLKGMRASAGEATKSDAWKEIEMLRSLESKGMAQPGTTSKKEAEFNARFLVPQFGLKPSEELKRTGSFSTAAWNSASWREREGNWAPNTEEQNKAILKQFEEERKATEKAFADYMSSSSGMVSYGSWEDDYAKLEALRQELLKTTQAASEFNMELYKKAAAGDTKRLEKEIPYLQKEGLDEQINEIAKSTEDGFNQLVQLSQRTAERMQDNFSDLFFDVWKGKLKTAEDYFKAFSDSIGRVWSNMAGQMVTQGLFGKDFKGGGALSSIADWLKGVNWGGSSTTDPTAGLDMSGHARGGIFDRYGMIPFASGGIVDRPTVFPFARGTGLMGEDGPEAIMPLKRLPSGKLGVEAAGGGGTNVQVIVQNYSGARVTQREQQGPGDMRQIFVMIGNDIQAGGPIARAGESAYGWRRVGR